jgi:hypothetical protein
VSGQLQLGAYVQEAYFDARFTREGDKLLLATDEPVTFSIGGFNRDRYMRALAEACGRAATLADEISISVQITLEENQGSEVPVVIRTPITVKTIDEIRSRLEQQTDHFAQYQDEQEERGVASGIRNNITRDQHNTVQQNRRNPNLAADIHRMQDNSSTTTVRVPNTPGEGEMIIYDGKEQRVIDWEDE